MRNSKSYNKWVSSHLCFYKEGDVAKKYGWDADSKKWIDLDNDVVIEYEFGEINKLFTK